MKYSSPHGRREIADGLGRLLEQARATEELPAELSLKLVRGLARGTRLLARGDLSDMDPGFEDQLAAVVRDLGSLVPPRKTSIAAALDKPNLLPVKPLSETLATFLEDPHQQQDKAARYLQLRDDLELLRDGLGRLDLIHEQLQTSLAMADELYFDNLPSFGCVSVYADHFMARFGVDPDPDGPFGFWAAAADTPDAEADARRAGAALAAAGPDAEQITARLTEAARAQGAPLRYLHQKLGRADAEQQAMATRVVATLALAAALRHQRRARINAVGAGPGELEALPDPAEAVLLGSVPDLGLELRAQQEPGEVRLILYFPDLDDLKKIDSARIPDWQEFPTGVVGRVPIAAEPPAPPASPDDQIQINAVYGSEDVEFVINLDPDTGDE